MCRYSCAGSPQPAVQAGILGAEMLAEPVREPGAESRLVEGAFVCGPVDHPQLLAEVVFTEELAVATAPTVAGIDELARMVAPKIVVLRAGCSYRQRLEEILARRGIVDLRRLEFGTLDSIIGCVAAGLGVMLLPRSVLAQARREGRVGVHELPAAEARVETLFIRRRDAYASSALEAFLDCARPAPRRVAVAE